MRTAHSTATLFLIAFAACANDTVRAQTPLPTTVYVAGLTAPVAFVQDPSNPSVQFVVEQRGRIRVVRNGALLGIDFLDLRAAVNAGGLACEIRGATRSTRRRAGARGRSSSPTSARGPGKRSTTSPRAGAAGTTAGGTEKGRTTT